MSNVRKWIDALRSGEFKQIQNQLHNQDGYCCLGVLTELAAQEGVVQKTVTTTGSVAYDGDSSAPTQAVLEWAGLPPHSEVFIKRENAGLEKVDDSIVNAPNPKEVTSAMSLNDNFRYTFEQIADALEREYLNEEGS